MGDKIILHIPYFQAPNVVFELELSLHEKIILLYLCRCANNSSQAFPSYNTISQKCSISRRTAIRTVNSLMEKGYLVKHTRPKKNGDNDTNVYEIVFPSVRQTPPPGARETPAGDRETPAGDRVTPNKKPYININNNDISKKLSTRANKFKNYQRAVKNEVSKHT